MKIAGTLILPHVEAMVHAKGKKAGAMENKLVSPIAPRRAIHI